MAAGRRLARRVAWFQAVATLLLAAALLILSVGHALGGLVGGGALLLGNLFLARLGLARDAPAASEAMGGLIGGLVGKWVVVGAVLLLNQPEFKGKTAYFAGVDQARFRRKVVPGDVLRLEIEITTLRRSFGAGKGVATVNGEKAAEAEILFAIS